MRSILVLLAASCFAFGQAPTTSVLKADPVPIPITVDIHIVVTITVSVKPAPGPTPPGPNPPSPPDPPPVPADPLIAKLQNAAVSDLFDKNNFNTLAKGFQDCVDSAGTAATGLELQQTLAKVLRGDIPDGIPDNTYAVLAAELKPLNTLMPSSKPTAPITDAVRKQVVALFTKIANACTQAAK